MPEANVANTITILGKTSTVKAATHWKTIALNDPANRAALKINSLFITNNSRLFYVDVDLRVGRLTPQVPGALNRDSIYTSFINILTIPLGATVVAISRDNPIWLQPGDFLQIIASRNYWADVVCSYEFVSDRDLSPTMTLAPPSQVLHINAAETYFPPGTSPSQGDISSGGAHLSWSPPFDDGGVAITNYVVQMRALLRYVASSATEGESAEQTIINGSSEIWSGWISLHKPVTDVTNLHIPQTVLTAVEYSNGPLFEADLADSQSALFDASLEIQGWQFRVTAINPVGVGPFSPPSAILKLRAIPSLDVTAEAGVNRVTLEWQKPALTPPAGTAYALTDYNVRWSSDNGMTWLPSPAGYRLYGAGTDTPSAHSTIVANLQNGVYYTFSVQPIVLKDAGTPYEQEVVGPWSAPTRNVMPPGEADLAALESQLQTLFVKWV
jgi:hypothetical protein